MLYFITGNKNKFEEVKAILGDVEQLNIDLEEIQEIDPKKIIEHKLNEARKHQIGDFIVEDTSLYLNTLNGLPGPLIKWFLKSVGNKGLLKIAKKFEDTQAEAKTIIGYLRGNEVKFFEGAINGNIVPERGENGFGWDKIFQPENKDKTFAEMSDEEKNSISMRKIAVENFKEYLDGV